VKRYTWIWLVGLSLTLVETNRAADVGTAFTYQGRLKDGSGPVTGTCDFRFQMYDAAAGGNLKGTNPQNKAGVAVDAGVFTVNDLDFGGSAMDGTARWLEISVCCPSPCAVVPLSPRVELTPTPHALALPGLYTQQHFISPNVIGGYNGNTVPGGVVGATIGGGGQAGFVNTVSGNFATVGGGEQNTASGNWSTIGGGDTNTASNFFATVGGGYNNTGSGYSSTVSGGVVNTASGSYATVGGGSNNTGSGDLSTVGGGFVNTASGWYATVGGGSYNTAGGDNATVGGGDSNTASGADSTVGGGASNTASGVDSTVSGGQSNTAKGYYSAVPGGSSNRAGGDFSFAAGNAAKVRDGDSGSPYYSGDANGDEGTFVWCDSGGNTSDRCRSTGPNQFLIRAAGGVGINTNDPDVELEINGGTELTLSDFTGFFMIGDQDGANLALDQNEIQARDNAAAADLLLNPHGGDVGIGTTAPTERLHVVGNIKASGTLITGSSITIDGNADKITASSGIISFDNENLVTTGNVGIGTTSPDNMLHVQKGSAGTVTGHTNAPLVVENDTNAYINILTPDASERGIIFGEASSNNVGGVVYNGAATPDGLQIRTNGNINRMVVDATGNVGIGTTSPAHPLHMGSGAHCTAGGTWTNASDRGLKENFSPVDPQSVLESVAALPLATWNYIKESNAVRHLGPVAQDFHAAFGLGADDRSITTVDADGVALAAIQGLYAIVQEKDCEIGELIERDRRKDHRVGELEDRNAKLEARIARLEALLFVTLTKGEKP